jgi:2'-5' RNA ligase
LNTQNDYWLGLWAIPNEEQSSDINNIKSRINQRLNGPGFPLHITLTGSFGLTYEELSNSIPKILSSIRPLKINYRDYFLDEYLFEAFYVKVLLSKELKRMRSELCKILNTNDDKFNPHMSLYYGEESRVKKSMILSDLPPLEGELNIDCLNIVSFNTVNFTLKILDKVVLECSSNSTAISVGC